MTKAIFLTQIEAAGITLIRCMIQQDFLNQKEKIFLAAQKRAHLQILH